MGSVTNLHLKKHEKKQEIAAEIPGGGGTKSPTPFRIYMGLHSPLEPLESDLNSQICNIRRKMRKDGYIKVCMVRKSENKKYFGRVAFYEISCIYMKQELLKMVLKNEGNRTFLHAYFV